MIATCGSISSASRLVPPRSLGALTSVVSAANTRLSTRRSLSNDNARLELAGGSEGFTPLGFAGDSLTVRSLADRSRVPDSPTVFPSSLLAERCARGALWFREPMSPKDSDPPIVSPGENPNRTQIAHAGNRKTFAAGADFAIGIFSTPQPRRCLIEGENREICNLSIQQPTGQAVTRVALSQPCQSCPATPLLSNPVDAQRRHAQCTVSIEG